MTIEKTHIFSDETAQEIKEVLSDIKDTLSVDAYTKEQTDQRISAGDQSTLADAKDYTDGAVASGCAAAVDGAKNYTDHAIENFPTTTQMNQAINAATADMLTTHDIAVFSLVDSMTTDNNIEITSEYNDQYYDSLLELFGLEKLDHNKFPTTAPDFYKNDVLCDDVTTTDSNQDTSIGFVFQHIPPSTYYIRTYTCRVAGDNDTNYAVFYALCPSGEADDREVCFAMWLYDPAVDLEWTVVQHGAKPDEKEFEPSDGIVSADNLTEYVDHAVQNTVENNSIIDRPYTTGIEVVHHDAVIVHHDEVYDAETPTDKDILIDDYSAANTEKNALLFNAAMYEILPTLRGGYSNDNSSASGTWRTIPEIISIDSTMPDADHYDKIHFGPSMYDSYSGSYSFCFNDTNTGPSLVFNGANNANQSNGMSNGGVNGCMYMFDYLQMCNSMDSYGQTSSVKSRGAYAVRGSDVKVDIAGTAKFWSTHDALSSYPSHWSDYTITNNHIPIYENYHFDFGAGVTVDTSSVDPTMSAHQAEVFLNNFLTAITPHESVLAYSPVIGMSSDSYNSEQSGYSSYRKPVNNGMIPSRLLIIDDAQLWEPEFEIVTDTNTLNAFGNCYEAEDPWGNRVIQDIDFWWPGASQTQQNADFIESTLIGQYNDSPVLALKCKEVIGGCHSTGHHGSFVEDEPRELYLYFQLLDYDFKYMAIDTATSNEFGVPPTYYNQPFLDHTYSYDGNISSSSQYNEASNVVLVCRGMATHDCVLGDYEYSGAPSDPSGTVENIIHNPIFPQNYFTEADSTLVNTSGSDHYFKSNSNFAYGSDPSFTSYASDYFNHTLPPMKGGIPTFAIYDGVFDYTAAYDEIITPAWDEDVMVARPECKIAGVDWDVPDTPDGPVEIAHKTWGYDDWEWEQSGAMWQSPYSYTNSTLSDPFPAVDKLQLYTYNWSYPLLDCDYNSASGFTNYGNICYHNYSNTFNNRSGDILITLEQVGEQSYLNINGDIELYAYSSYNDASFGYFTALVFDREWLFGEYADKIQMPKKTFTDMNMQTKDFEIFHDCGEFYSSFVKYNSGWPSTTSAESTDEFKEANLYRSGSSSNGSAPYRFTADLVAGTTKHDGQTYDVVAFVAGAQSNLSFTSQHMWHLDARIPVTIVEG